MVDLRNPAGKVGLADSLGLLPGAPTVGRSTLPESTNGSSAF